MMLAIVFLLFIFLSHFTVLNMLIGILCEVVTEVSRDEQEQATLARLRRTILCLLECYDKNDDHHIGRDEFDLLMANPETSQILRRFEIDSSQLLAMRDVLFEVPRDSDSEDEAPVPASPGQDKNGR